MKSMPGWEVKVVEIVSTNRKFIEDPINKYLAENTAWEPTAYTLLPNCNILLMVKKKVE